MWKINVKNLQGMHLNLKDRKCQSKLKGFKWLLKQPQRVHKLTGI